jgi:RNA polymerase sigma-70 factor, ECF subfamily
MCNTDGAWDWSQVHQHCLREARRYTSSHADAEDVAQDATLRAWRRRHALNDPDALWSWLSRITRNEAMRLYERTRPESRADLPETSYDADLPERVAMRLDLEQALTRLSLADQRLVVLHYGCDLTCAAAADKLHLRLSTTKVRLHRIRRQLATSLAGTYGS